MTAQNIFPEEIENEDFLQELDENVSEENDDFLSEITDEAKEKLYSLAYEYYNFGKYEDASDLFRLLMQMSPNDERFWLGGGACFQQQKEYNQAIAHYAFAAIQFGNNPYFPFHSAECLLALQQVDAGMKALNDAKKIAEQNKKQYANMLNEIEILKAVWESKN